MQKGYRNGARHVLFEVKNPEESKAPCDFYKVLAEVPGDQAFRPLKDGGCPLIK